jgi:hypothetical protein
LTMIPLAAAAMLVQWVSGAFAADASALCPSPGREKRVAVTTASAAVAAAKPELTRAFSPQDIARYDPYSAKLVAGVWYVRGRLQAGALGGTPEAQVCQSNGRVLHVYQAE